MRYMGEIKNRSVRLDQENYDWLVGLPGRSLNEAIERLRTQNGGESPQETAVSEILELVRGLPDATDIEGVIRNVIQEFRAARTASVPVTTLPAASGAFEETVPVDNRAKNCRCRHCGQPFAGPRFSTLCSECKSTGHTLTPAECPRCNEASAL